MSGPVSLVEGDCLASMAAMEPDSVDAIVTDPPYHLASIVKRFGGAGAAAAQEGSDGLYRRASRGFMGKEWDGGDIAFRPETWAAMLRVAKPGAHLIAFNHSRTWHHMALAIEAAGWEIRDSILEIYSASDAWAGFLETLTAPQLAALSAALGGSSDGLLAWLYGSGFPKSHDVAKGVDKALGAEREAGVIKGRSGALRACMTGDFTGGDYMATAPATPEAAAWEGWGTALKPAFEPIILARKPLAESSVARQCLATGTGGLNIDAGRIVGNTPGATRTGEASAAARYADRGSTNFAATPGPRGGDARGRWPANVVHDGSQEVLARFPRDGNGSAARYFYSAKADKADRAGSTHPTVKPQELMRWLVRLVTRRGAVVLDPFGGSGATGWAAAAEGRRAILCERDADYLPHLRRRIADLDPETQAETPAADAMPGQLGLFGGGT